MLKRPTFALGPVTCRSLYGRLPFSPPVRHGGISGRAPTVAETVPWLQTRLCQRLSPFRLLGRSRVRRFWRRRGNPVRRELSSAPHSAWRAGLLCLSVPSPIRKLISSVSPLMGFSSSKAYQENSAVEQ